MPPGTPGSSFSTICLIHLDAVDRYRIDELRSSDSIMLDSLRRVTAVVRIHQLMACV